jgi:Fe2+ transport system protein B
MKTEFLQNFKVGEQALPKEVIDAILAENGRDIENAKKSYADYDSIKEQLQAAKEGLKAFEGVDVAELQGKINQLTADLSRKDTEWKEKLAGMEFDGKLREAIGKAKGRSAKAIAALLDTETLRKSEDQEKDIAAALEKLKKENDYLFESGKPAPYAGGTGAGGTGGFGAGSARRGWKGFS